MPLSLAALALARRITTLSLPAAGLGAGVGRRTSSVGLMLSLLDDGGGARDVLGSGKYARSSHADDL